MLRDLQAMDLFGHPGRQEQGLIPAPQLEAVIRLV
jgi:hypothetical protein